MIELVAGRVVEGRYEVEALIGRGGMAAVYRVRHTSLGTLHAMKLLTTTTGRERLLAEGRVQAALVHPNIVTVTDVVMVDGSPGLVMEYVRGPSLERFLDEERPDADQIDALAHGILDGIAAAHAMGVIHRDLKPANVMLAIQPGRLVPKVSDFGLVKLLSTEADSSSFGSTRTGMTMGTPAYMAPEQIRDSKSVDERADVFSTAAMLFELVAGRRPFDGTDTLDIFVKIAQGQRPRIRDVCRDVPERWERAIEAGLEIDRERRTPDLATLRATWFEGARPVLVPWTADVVARAEKLGGGGVISDLKTGPIPRPTVPIGGPDVVGDTLAPSGAVDSLDTLAPQAAPPPAPKVNSETLLPEPGSSPLTIGPEAAPGPLPEVPPSFRPMPIAALGAGAVVVMGVLLVVCLGIVQPWHWGQGSGTASAEVVPPPNPPAAVVVPVTPPEPIVEPVAPPVETPVAPPAEKPPQKPSSGTAERPRPTPVVIPPPPVAVEVPQAAPMPPPEPVGPPPVVSITSDVTVFLTDADGRRADPRGLEPGTYTLVAFFEDRVPTTISTLVLVPGSRVSVHCAKAQGRCKVEGP